MLAFFFVHDLANAAFKARYLRQIFLLIPKLLHPEFNCLNWIRYLNREICFFVGIDQKRIVPFICIISAIPLQAKLAKILKNQY